MVLFQHYTLSLCFTREFLVDKETILEKFSRSFCVIKKLALSSTLIPFVAYILRTGEIIICIRYYEQNQPCDVTS